MDNINEVIIILLICTCVCLAHSKRGNAAPVSVTSGVFWKEIRDVEIYESSVPLVYRSTWPGLDNAHLERPQGEGFCEGTANDPDCVLFGWIVQVDKTVSRQLSWLNQSLGETSDNLRKPNYRNRRSLHFLGNFAHWCCGVATNRQLKPLFTNQENMGVFEQQLQSQMQEAYAEIDNVTYNMNVYSEEVGRTFAQVIDVGINITKMLDRFKSKVFVADQKNDHKAYSLLQIDAYHVVRQLQTLQLITRLEILSQCREKKIPNSIVTLSKFKLDLLQLQASIKDDGYELSIPVEEVTKYLKLEIADCVISGESILVNVKVPIRRLGSHWKLFELISVPFAWKNFTCSIQQGVTFLAADRGRLMTIQGVAINDCHPYANPLCYVPRYAGDVVSGSLCPRAMFEGATIQDLSGQCVFSCVPSQAPIVTRVEEDVYVLTHVSGILDLKCRNGGDQRFELHGGHGPGAIRITVACDCRLSLNNETLVAENYPCNKKISVSEVIHIVPASWSKLKSMKVPARNGHSSNIFDTVEECLDENWPTTVPHWNMSYVTSRRDVRPPTLIMPAGQVLPILSWFLHVLYFILVTIIVIRNPQLIGFYVVNRVRSEPLELYVNSDSVYEGTMYCVLITVFVVLCWAAKRLFFYFRKAREVSEDVVMTSKGKIQEDGELPRNLPLAEIDGRELRITLEWWDMKSQDQQSDK